MPRREIQPPSDLPQGLLRRNWLWLALLVALVAVHVALSFGTFQLIEEDAFISLRYVRNALSGHGVVFNPGERLEGYSNPLWVFGLIVLGAVGGVDALPHLAAGASLAAACACLGVLLWYGQRRQWHPLVAGLAVCWLLLRYEWLFWSLGGLETALYALLVLLTVLPSVTGSAALAWAIAPGLAAVCRPEGVLWLLPTLVLWYRHFSWRGLVQRFGLAAIFPTMLLAWRLIYYKNYLPSTIVLVYNYWQWLLERGTRYFTEYFMGGGVMTALVLLGALSALLPLSKPHRTRALLGYLLLYLAFIARVGGDGKPELRFFMHLHPLLVVFAAETVQQLLAWRPLPANRVLRASLAFLLVAMLGVALVPANRRTLRDLATLRQQPRELQLRMARLRDHTRELNPQTLCALAARRHLRPGHTAVFSEMGKLPYMQPEVVFLDHLGLTDRFFNQLDREVLQPLGESGYPEATRRTEAYLHERKPEWIMVKPELISHRTLTCIINGPSFARRYRTEQVYYTERNGQPELLLLAFRRLTEDAPDLGAEGGSIAERLATLPESVLCRVELSPFGWRLCSAPASMYR